jgi:septum site-determining protein MinC
MKNAVVIKSNQYGLTLVLDEEVSFEQLIRDICRKFAESRAFFGTTTMVLAIEGRAVSAEEAAVIIEAIELNSDITISLIQEKQDFKDAEMLGKIDKFYFEKLYDNAKIIKGSVKDHQIVHTDTSVLILGDVKNGSKVEAAGNVIVLGEVAGKVHAGYPDQEGCYIVAGEITASSVSIGSVTGEARIQTKWYQRTRKNNREPVAVVVWDKGLLTEPLSGGIIKQLKES